MKRFFSALALCVSLLTVLTFWLFPSVTASEDPIITLLNYPAPPAPNPLVSTPSGSRPPEFYSKTKPPPDDAPIEELMDYWSKQSGGYQELGFTPMPSGVVAGRILNELEGEPHRITEFLNVLQDDRRAADMAREMYRRISSGDTEDEGEQKATLRAWLTVNTPDFSGDLERSAAKVKDVAEYVSNHEELLNLSKVDWDRAAPIVNKLYGDKGQKVSQVLATWALYKRAMQSGGSDVDRYRDELKTVVENKEATDAMRDMALDGLLKEKDWSGRDDWYMTLLADETLDSLQVNGSTYTGLTTIMYYDEDDRLTEKMIAAMGSDSVTVRTAAAKNLMLRLNRIESTDNTLAMRKSIIVSLLPWLENRAWIKAEPSQRENILRALQSVKMPEAVPALIAALEERQKVSEYPYARNTAHNAANMMANAANTANYTTRVARPDEDVPPPDDEPQDEPTTVTTTNANGAVARAMNLATNAVAAASNAITSVSESEYFPLRSTAISALAFQRDGRAVPALRRMLPVVNEWERGLVVKALLQCNGFTTDERVAALEYVARSMGAMASDGATTDYRSDGSLSWPARIAFGTAVAQQSTMVAPAEPVGEDAEKEFDNYAAPAEEVPSTVSGVAINANAYAGAYGYGRSSELDEESMQAMLAGQLVQLEDVDEDLVKGMVERIGALDKREPLTASLMRRVVLGWKGTALNAMLLGDIRNGTIDPDAVVKLLSIRKELREKQSPDVTNLRTGHPYAVGIAACLLEERADYDSILSSGADASKTALLACGRLIRSQLPVAKVVPLMKSSNKLLALAAERFLESEDSAEARSALLEKYPNQAKILGAKTVFDVPGFAAQPGTFLRDVFGSVNPYFVSGEYAYMTFGQVEDFSAVEKRLQKEVLANSELLGVYAYDQHFVRIYKDKAVFSWEDDPARYRERTLEPEQFESLKSFLASSNVDKMPPFLACMSDCESKELIMLGRSGGRRIFLKTGSKLPEFFAGLKYFFEEMKRPPAKLKYYAGDQIPGLEVLYADDKLSAVSVWKQGADLRVLISDAARERAITAEVDQAGEAALEEIAEDEAKQRDHYQKFYKMRAARMFEAVNWHSVADGQLGPTVMQPRDAEYVPVNDGLAPANTFGQWAARTGAVEIRADEGGLYKIVARRPQRIRTGNYSDPVVTANGRWAIVSKYSDETGGSLVRVNLATNREYKIESELPVQKAIAFIPARNLVLAKGYDDDHHDGEYAEDYHVSAHDNGLGYYLINPDTGVVYPGGGELRPIAQQSFRPLQPAATPGEYWAAIPRGSAGTLVGTYAARTGKFTQLLKLPKIIFDSTEMWVDGGRVYFTHEGHLLSAPLAATDARPR